MWPLNTLKSLLIWQWPLGGQNQHLIVPQVSVAFNSLTAPSFRRHPFPWPPGHSFFLSFQNSFIYYLLPLPNLQFQCPSKISSWSYFSPSAMAPSFPALLVSVNERNFCIPRPYFYPVPGYNLIFPLFSFICLKQRPSLEPRMTWIQNWILLPFSSVLWLWGWANTLSLSNPHPDVP